MSLLRGALHQAQVVHALTLRETRTRFGQHKLGYIWALVEPLSFVAMFAAMYHIIGREPPAGMDMVTFVTTGYLPYQLVMTVGNRVAEAINGNKALLVYPHVQVVDLVYGRVALEVATMITVFALIMAAHGAYTGTLRIDDPLMVISALSMAAALGTTWGVTLCALGVIWPVVDRIRGPLVRPLFWISGIWFTAADLPLRIREALLWNPILQCVEMMREGWFGAYSAPWVSLPYALAFVLGLGFFGFTLERAVRRKVRLA